MMDKWEEIGDAAAKNPGRFVILIIWQYICYIKNKILGGKDESKT